MSWAYKNTVNEHLCERDDCFVYYIQRLQVFLIYLTILQQQQNYITHFSSKLPLSIGKKRRQN